MVRGVALAGAGLALVTPAAVGAGTAVTLAETPGAANALVAEMTAQLLTARGFTVTRAGVMTPAAAAAAADAGTVDVYVTETATLLERVLAKPKERRDAVLPALLGAALGPRAQSVVGIAVADDAPQVACTRAAVRAHKLTGVLTIGRAAPKLTYAVTPAHVTRADGLVALRATFRRIIVRPGTGRFDVIAQRRAHCVLSSGTEPRAPRLNLTALRDAKRRLAGTPQRGVVVGTAAYLATAPAEFAPTVTALLALATTSAVTDLRSRTELDAVPVGTVAGDFLRANGLLSPV